MNEQRKYEVIKGLVDHPDTANKDRAALILGCTKRHINRMIQGYIKDGKAFFIHGNRGKKPATTIRPDVRSQVIDLYRTKYYEANFEHYTELLKKHEGISISSSSVMSILESEYILSPKATKAKRRRIKQALRAKKQAATSKKELSQIQANLVAVEDAHSRRPRCAYFGELLQMDATPYEWVPGQIWHLHLAIDDASGVVTGAWFDTQETLNGYYHVFEQILTDYGIPYKFLTDKRTVFTYKKKGALSDDKDTYTQFAYACKQLGIQLESSSVPQAKGRIERLNQTLQSRLPIEFRLAGVTDINNANEFLYHYIKEFNEKFSLPCNGIKSVFEKQPSKEKINLTLAVLTERTVDAGHAIQFEKKFYKMVDNKGMQTHYRKGTKVMLIKAFDRSLFAC
ncbi:ISNCY family transposase, partial [Lachnoanaerobaculum gingivalis]